MSPQRAALLQSNAIVLLFVFAQRGCFLREYCLLLSNLLFQGCHHLFRGLLVFVDFGRLQLRDGFPSSVAIHINHPLLNSTLNKRDFLLVRHGRLDGVFDEPHLPVSKTASSLLQYVLCLREQLLFQLPFLVFFILSHCLSPADLLLARTHRQVRIPLIVALNVLVDPASKLF